MPVLINKLFILLRLRSEKDVLPGFYYNILRSLCGIIIIEIQIAPVILCHTNLDIQGMSRRKGFLLFQAYGKDFRRGFVIFLRIGENTRNRFGNGFILLPLNAGVITVEIQF